MIALNEIISNKEEFERKYKLMGKPVNLTKILRLEESFINLDKKANELRSECNKLCSEVASLVNTNKNTTQAISQINELDKEISRLEKQSSKAMKLINKKLKTLPNLPLEENILNIAQKTKNTGLNSENFIKQISENIQIKEVNQYEKSFIKSLKKIVIKADDLPIIVKLKPEKKQKYLFICGTNGLELFIKIQKLLSDNAKFLTIKSIKTLKKESSKELVSTLSDGSSVFVQFSGEFISRKNSIKLYDKKIDMTKFVNIIKISIK